MRIFPVLAVAVVIGLTTSAFVVLSGGLPYHLLGPGASTQSRSGQLGSGPDPLHPLVGDSFTYDCAKPAISTQLSCDQLPTGYVILPREANAPAAPRLANMTESAYALLQKTYGNGVCDPNETWLTSPLDCGIPGSLVADPYTGRAGSPAVVCQLGNAPQA